MRIRKLCYHLAMKKMRERLEDVLDDCLIKRAPLARRIDVPETTFLYRGRLDSYAALDTRARRKMERRLVAELARIADRLRRYVDACRDDDGGHAALGILVVALWALLTLALLVPMVVRGL